MAISYLPEVESQINQHFNSQDTMALADRHPCRAWFHNPSGQTAEKYLLPSKQLERFHPVIAIFTG